MVTQPSMDLGQDEDFIFKHPYFFSKLTFKFEGLRPEIEKDLENVIKVRIQKILITIFFLHTRFIIQNQIV